MIQAGEFKGRVLQCIIVMLRCFVVVSVKPKRMRGAREALVTTKSCLFRLRAEQVWAKKKHNYGGRKLCVAHARREGDGFTVPL